MNGLPVPRIKGIFLHHGTHDFKCVLLILIILNDLFLLIESHFYWPLLLFFLTLFYWIIVDLQKAMAPHSSTLAWKIPWMEEPGRLRSVGSLRVWLDWESSLSLFTFVHWRRKWQPTPVFLPGESQGRGSLVGCRLWGRRVGHDWSDLAAAAAAVDLQCCVNFFLLLFSTVQQNDSVIYYTFFFIFFIYWPSLNSPRKLTVLPFFLLNAGENMNGRVR